MTQPQQHTPAAVISTRKLSDGWHAVIDGVVGSRCCRTEAVAQQHAERVVRGLAIWEPLRDRQLQLVHKSGHDAGSRGFIDNSRARGRSLVNRKAAV